jgi:hypothetical protein
LERSALVGQSWISSPRQEFPSVAFLVRRHHQLLRDSPKAFRIRHLHLGNI